MKKLQPVKSITQDADIAEKDLSEGDYIIRNRHTDKALRTYGKRYCTNV